ncbi:MAG: transposase [Opitutae bacterium]|nr:transposase [Opitutae bacterium]
MSLSRGHEALRRHRISLSGATYFLTLCTQERKPRLTCDPVAGAIRTEVADIETSGHWTPRGAVIMPDHFHVLVTLGRTLPLGQVIARFKTKTRAALAGVGARWQDNYYEHRLRPDEPVENVLHYLYLNPYRNRLLPAHEVYPLFWLGAEEANWFTPLLDDGRPFAEWLR